MNRNEIIEQLKEFFDVSELVCPHTYREWGQRSWLFLDTNYLLTLLVIRRDILKVGMYVNTEGLTQRGLRCNLCQLVKDKTKSGTNYLSAHIYGKGCDFTTKELTADQCRARIIANKDLLPFPIRLEKDVTWVHFDIFPFSEEKIFIF